VSTFTIPDNIYLLGMPGSGKSTLGIALSEQLRITFFDLDQYIENQAGKHITQMFTEDGEDGFRVLENNCLRRLSEQSYPKVIATGGGTPCFHHNIDYIINNGVGIFLDVPLKTIAERLIEQGTEGRPLLKDKTPKELLGQLQDHFLQRKAYYLKAQIHMEGPSIAMDDIIEALRAI
jgi:shikimate kinase